MDKRRKPWLPSRIFLALAVALAAGPAALGYHPDPPRPENYFLTHPWAEADESPYDPTDGVVSIPLWLDDSVYEWPSNFIARTLDAMAEWNAYQTHATNPIWTDLNLFGAANVGYEAGAYGIPDCHTLPNKGVGVLVDLIDLEGGALATTFAVPALPSNDRMECASIVIDEAENWHLGSGDPPALKFDLQSVITHEIGHSIGWKGGHFAAGVDEPPAYICDISHASYHTMCESIAPGTRKLRSLEWHDRSAVYSGYAYSGFCPLCPL